MKKRGFGEGRWNGFGGNAEAGETIEQTMERELLEEAGITALELKEMGTLTFQCCDNDVEPEVHFFEITRWKGKPVEGEEMRPQWFDIDKIPYDSMWPDDRYWLPMLLAGKKFKGSFLFDSTGGIVKNTMEAI